MTAIKATKWATAAALATLATAAVATPVQPRSTHHNHRMHAHAAHGHRIYVRTARPVAMDPLDFFIFNGNQPYFDGYNGQPGYMGYYGGDRLHAPAHELR